MSERHYQNFYKYVTGREVSLDQLLERSNDIYDLTRLINTHLGASRKDDSLPYKVWANPVLTGPTAGRVISQEEFNKLLSLYYSKRGWSEDGIPLAEVEKKFNDT
jgi:aldehyde:ferredoxin oxidoreductase